MLTPTTPDQDWLDQKVTELHKTFPDWEWRYDPNAMDRAMDQCRRYRERDLTPEQLTRVDRWSARHFGTGDVCSEPTLSRLISTVRLAQKNMHQINAEMHP